MLSPIRFVVLFVRLLYLTVTLSGAYILFQLVSRRWSKVVANVTPRVNGRRLRFATVHSAIYCQKHMSNVALTKLTFGENTVF